MQSTEDGAIFPARQLVKAERKREQKAQSRLAVERFLQDADPRETFSPAAIALAVSLPALSVRRVINGLLRHVHIVNVQEGRGEGLYKWSRAERVVPQSAPVWSGLATIDAAYWRRLQPQSVRPDAMRAFELPSMEGGKLHERRVPLLLASSVQSLR